MPKFKNVSSLGDLFVPFLGRDVLAGEVVEVPVDSGLSDQPDVWAPVSESKEK